MNGMVAVVWLLMFPRNATVDDVALGQSMGLSDEARRRILSVRGEPLFLAHWERALFMHFEVDPDALRRAAPFELELRDGRAIISLVAFTMRDMRPRLGGWAGRWMFKPIAAHPFLNVRAYVRHRGEAGICFLAEWLSNWLSVQLGPRIYGLPYRFAKIDYHHAHETNEFNGTVVSPKSGGRFSYTAKLSSDAFAPCPAGSFDEFLLERYTCFNQGKTTHRFFRIWHPPWPQTRAEVTIKDDSLITNAWPWFRGARYIGANYSPGFADVWMGRAQDCKTI